MSNLIITYWTISTSVICFLIWLKGPKMEWYLIYRYSYARNGQVIKTRKPIDGVYAASSDVAIAIAEKRNDWKTTESLQAQWCKTVAMQELAIELNDRHCDEVEIGLHWTETDWQEFIAIPTYVGDQDKYLRTWHL